MRPGLPASSGTPAASALRAQPPFSRLSSLNSRLFPRHPQLFQGESGSTPSAKGRGLRPPSRLLQLGGRAAGRRSTRARRLQRLPSFGTYSLIVSPVVGESHGATATRRQDTLVTEHAHLRLAPALVPGGGDAGNGSPLLAGTSVGARRSSENSSAFSVAQFPHPQPLSRKRERGAFGVAAQMSVSMSARVRCQFSGYRRRLVSGPKYSASARTRAFQGDGRRQKPRASRASETLLAPR